jgi:hypothetical protein
VTGRAGQLVRLLKLGTKEEGDDDDDDDDDDEEAENEDEKLDTKFAGQLLPVS